MRKSCMFRNTKKQRVENVNNKKNNVLFRQDRRSKDPVIPDFNNIDAFIKSQNLSPRRKDRKVNLLILMVS